MNLNHKLVSRFWDGLPEEDDPSECWFWIGQKNESGYGVLRLNGKYLKAHRVSYEYFKNEKIPEKMQIDHLCSNRSCVNPDHLDVVTQQENLKRSLERRVVCKNGHDLTIPGAIKPGTTARCLVCYRRKNREGKRAFMERKRNAEGKTQ